MDWPRLLRALDAAGVERTEKRRGQMLAGTVSPDEISAAEWATFARHDALHDHWYSGTIDEIDQVTQ